MNSESPNCILEYGERPNSSRKAGSVILAWLCDDRSPPLNATLNARDASEEAQASRMGGSTC